MEVVLNKIIWSQFGAAIDMLANALRACPDDLWLNPITPDDPEPQYSAFWYVAYHALFWLDLYLSGAVAGFAPPPPFTLEELDPAGLLPDRAYTREELQAYLAHCRAKCQAVVQALSEERGQQPCPFPWGTLTFAELLLYNMRHVQEHASQLNLFLGQQTSAAPGWVTIAKSGQ